MCAGGHVASSEGSGRGITIRTDAQRHRYIPAEMGTSDETRYAVN